ncbi:MAG: transposase [Chloroflexota bacterium]|nr:transposase [Chloroflexota bacterium]
MNPILPDTFWPFLLAFAGCFGAPTFRNFCGIVAGWVHCLGRHTITAVALASGDLERRHVSTFHRFFACAQWTLDSLGFVIVKLAEPWLDANQPLLAGLDDTLARKTGKCVSLGSMHHDPLLSPSARKPFTSFGHVWVMLSLWVPLPFTQQRGVALPILFRLYVGKRRGGQKDGPSRRSTGKRQEAAQRAAEQTVHRTKLELGREMVDLLASWVGDRHLVVAMDSAYAGRTMLERRPANVDFVSRLRLDAALWTPPPARRLGQKGRPRRRGQRLPKPSLWASTRRCWHRLTLTLYGRAVTMRVFTKTALWYVALRDQPVRIVIVRDPSGRRRDEAFFCTDVRASAAFILQTYASRWCLEVAFRDGKQHLGFEDPQQQSERAVRRTAPIAFIVYDLVWLWAASRAQAGQALGWVPRPWYRHKTAPSFADLLTALRHERWRSALFDPPCDSRRRKNSLPSWSHAVLATA